MSKIDTTSEQRIKQAFENEQAFASEIILSMLTFEKRVDELLELQDQQ